MARRSEYYILFFIIFVIILNSTNTETVEADEISLENDINQTLSQHEVDQTGSMGDNVAEIYNFLDGDSFGIGPMHEFVYGWQAIIKAMAMKNNVEVRKRAGMQRMALAGLNGISLISHIGVTQIMINGTRSFCFGGVVRPVIRSKIVCKGAMYQEGQIKCKLPYLRYVTSEGHQVCVGKKATVRIDKEILHTDKKIIDKEDITSTTKVAFLDIIIATKGDGGPGYERKTTTTEMSTTDMTTTQRSTTAIETHLETVLISSLSGAPTCYNGFSYPKFHYDYICERSEVRVRHLNLSDSNGHFNARNPVVRRVEYYRSENDVLKQCAEWYGCNFRIAEEAPQEEPNICLRQGNETAFVGFGGRYWLSIYYAKLSSWARYFQSHTEYPWYSPRPVQPVKGNIRDLLMKVNIGPDMNLHYNLNGIHNKYPPFPYSPDIMRNDGQVQPSNQRVDWKSVHD